ncbi:hypothetical protein C8J55DRAFT_462162 [Lentinula edodes]|uniref:Uncharacterized protein n=1 Tax=Lentinula lateritia TaxID=40482 RepID=A0A9W8ZUF0_9AGAR|nr:hypothetical protein C8J55DRAFT_462162 [Lentinula edodes]
MSTPYYPLLQEESDNVESETPNDLAQWGRIRARGTRLIANSRNQRWKIAFFVSFLANIFTVFNWIYALNSEVEIMNNFPPQGQMIYIPSEAAIDYELVKYHLGIGHDIEIYEKPPSPEVDAAWVELTKSSIARVPQSVAQKLPNETWPVPGTADAPEYIISPDVFHALHCLDLLRMKLYPDHYSSKFPLNQKGHAEHCVGHIRQSLMCFGDMTTNVYQYSKNHGYAFLRTDVAHTCRDFEKLKSWTKDNWLDLKDEMLSLDIEGNPI